MSPGETGETGETGQLGELRRRILEERRQRSVEQIRKLSSKVVSRFMAAVADSWKGRNVGIFRALPGEILLDELDVWLRAAGAKVFFPRVTDGQAGLLEFAEAPAFERGWERGMYGILEPSRTIAACDPAALDVIAVPGVAFSPTGARIGMGKGFYDRYLPRASSALRVSLAFDFQIVERFAQNAWDQRVDWVLTESRDFRLSPGLDRILK